MHELVRPYGVAALAIVFFAKATAAVSGTEYWTVRGGSTTVWLNPEFAAFPSASMASGEADVLAADASWTVPIDAQSPLKVVLREGGAVQLAGGIRHIGRATVNSHQGNVSLDDFVIAVDEASPAVSFVLHNPANRGGSGLLLRDANVQFDRFHETLVISGDDLRFATASPTDADLETSAARSVGMVLVRVDLLRLDDVEPAAAPAGDSTSGSRSSRTATGPDVIVSELGSMIGFGSAFTCSESGTVCTRCSGNGAICTANSACPFGQTCDPDPAVCPSPGETCDVRIAAFSVATRSCNLGDQPAEWFSSSSRHPVIAQNMYRLHQNRFEQIGMAWVKHGFATVNGDYCGPCTVPPPPNDSVMLGVGCSDPYDATLNGQQANLGPRSEVNPYTGFFPDPFGAPNRTCSGSGEPCSTTDDCPAQETCVTPPTDPLIGRRLQVHESDLDPTLNPEALYFVEGHYIVQDEVRRACSNNGLPCTTDANCSNGAVCGPGNLNNNASYRRITIEPPSASNGFRYVAIRSDQIGVTQVEQAAIRAWQDVDPAVVESDIQVPNDGLFILAAKATDLGTGRWRYEYALQNLNVNSAGSSFSLPLPTDHVVTNIGFHDVHYHSGERFEKTDWAPLVASGSVTWSTERFDENPQANALRWGSVYNFRFDVNASPDPSATVTLGLFSGPLASVQATIVGPSLDLIDCNGNGLADPCDVNCAAEGCGVDCGGSNDCNGNLVPDECELDCNGNGIADTCDITNCPPGELACGDCNSNTVPDGCEADCDGDGIPSDCDDDEDSDGDGIDDCLDLCPHTSTLDFCACPNPVCCCFPLGGCQCFDMGFSWESCLNFSGVPDCIPSQSCRDGCVLGDVNNDGGIDLIDFAGLQGCFSGPSGAGGAEEPSAECQRVFDYTVDMTVSLSDYELFLGQFADLGGMEKTCQEEMEKTCHERSARQGTVNH